VLEAVAEVLRRGGVQEVTTNRIAEVAGVSIGSLYQYFPDKRAIFTALLGRHEAEMGAKVEHALVQGGDDPLGAIVGALIDAHAATPDLYALLWTEVPHSLSSESALQGAVRIALPGRSERAVFVVAQLIESLTHACVLKGGMPPAAAKREVLRAVHGYLKKR
jgi:AcrR family transcriptional regulator